MKCTAEELRHVAIFEGLPDSEIAWFAEHGDRVALRSGQHMFERGQPAQYMWIVVRGAIEGYEEVGGQELLVATTCAGQVTGMLPFSRMKQYPRYTVAIEDSVVIRIDKADFTSMLAASEEVGQRLVAVMSDRVRGDVRLEQQHEKMAALGRLSAGLAHELNNPAAAIRRASDALATELSGLTELLTELVSKGLNASHIELITRIRTVADSRRNAAISPLERGEREEAVAEWLETCGVPNAWELAGTFVDAGLQLEDFGEFRAEVPEILQAAALKWLACVLDVRRVFGEIGSSAERISELVGSVKLYSHMDQSAEHRPIDIREGVQSTLKLFASRLREKDIRLLHEFEADLPRVSGHPGELNQVWTNLIENAMEAVEAGGQICIRARRHDAHLDVTVIDDGRGIPHDDLQHVFEPFFTTKAVGEGAGLGLDIAQRIVRTHRGSMHVESRPGRTEFRVRLPEAD